MPIEVAWLWGNKALSDVTLLLFAAGDEPANGLGDQPATAPVMELYLHKLVVMSVSQYFRDHLDRWASAAADQEQQPQPIDPPPNLQQPADLPPNQQHSAGQPADQQQPAEPAPDQQQHPDDSSSQEERPPAKRARTQEPGTQATEHAGNVIRLTLFPDEPHAAFKAVMHHAYSGYLPNDPALLAWMVLRADYLLMQDTVGACMAQLSALAEAGSLTVSHAVLMHVLQATHADPGMVQRLGQLDAKVLSLRLGDTRQVLLDEHLLAQFIQLPFAMLKQWAALDSLTVDHENTVAVLLTAWYDHQLDSDLAGSSPTERQCKELSSMLRLNSLTPSFQVQVMPHLKWYRVPAGLPEQHGLLRMLMSMNQVHATYWQPALEAGGVAGQRVPAQMQQQWSFTRQQLEQLWASTSLQLDNDIYFAGMDIIVELKMKDVPGDSTPPQRTLDVHLMLWWPFVLFKHGLLEKVPTPLAALSCEIAYGTTVTRPMKSIILKGGSETCWSNSARRTFSRVDELVQFMEGHGPLRVTFSKPG